MKSGEINSLFKNLSKVVKNPRSDLKYKNKFTLLVSVVLSAQCTDVNVNNVTRNIYPKYNKPEHFVRLGRKNIEKLIKKLTIKEITNLISEGKKISKKEIYNYCLKLKNEN